MLVYFNTIFYKMVIFPLQYIRHILNTNLAIGVVNISDSNWILSPAPPPPLGRAQPVPPASCSESRHPPPVAPSPQVGDLKTKVTVDNSIESVYFC